MSVLSRTVIDDLIYYRDQYLDEIIRVLLSTIHATLAKAGMEIREVNGQKQIVETNAVAMHVADIVPELADVIVEYNHYLIRGDINRKQELLKKLADALEPRKKELNNCCKGLSDDFFYLANNMNVRHNNSNAADTKKYNAVFASLNKEQQEKWYDTIYEQGLALFVMLEQQNRSKLIKDYKSKSPGE